MKAQQRKYAIAHALIIGRIELDEFEIMLECAYDDGNRSEQLLLQAAAELAGPRFESRARMIGELIA